MKTDRDFLVEALQVYADGIMRSSFYWNTLRTNVYITDVSELKVRVEFVFTQSKDKYLKSFRRIGMHKVVENLDEQLGFKKKYKTDVQFNKTDTANDWGGKFEYGTCLVKYLIPRDLYNQLETLIKIDNRAFIKEKKDERLFS